MEKILLLLCLVFLPITSTIGQGVKEIDFYFTSDTIAVEYGSTFTNFLVVKNRSNQKLEIESLEALKNYPGLLLAPNVPFYLDIEEVKEIPIKFIASTNFMEMEENNIGFRLYYKTGKTSKNTSTSFYRKRKVQEEIAIYSIAPQTYLDPNAIETSLTLFVENQDYARRSIKLEFRIKPQGLIISQNEMTLVLEGKEKRIIELQISVNRRQNFFPEFNIKVEATDINTQKIVGNTTIKAIVLSHNRQVMRTPDPISGKNFIEMAYNQFSSSYDYLQLRANSEFEMSNGINASFNTAVDYYLNEEKYSLYDTWLEVEHKKSTLRLGNIYANDYDFSVSGRGAKANIQVGNTDLEFLALDKNFNLFGNYFVENESSKLLASKYKFANSKTFNAKVSYLFDHNSRQAINTHLAHFTSSFFRLPNHNFQLEAGLSHEKAILNNKENMGGSVGINYQTSLVKWDFQSQNDYATKNYAGLNRGSFTTDQNLGYRFSKNNRAFLQYRNSQTQPEYLDYQNHSSLDGNAFYPYYFSSSQSIKTGIQFSSYRWRFMLSPQIENQKNISSFINDALLSYRFLTNTSLIFLSHAIDFSAEYSYSKSENASDFFHAAKTTLTYRFQNFSVNGTLQYNPYNVMDLNRVFTGNPDFINYNIYSTYSFKTFNNKITGSVSAGFNHSQLYNNTNKNLNSILEYKISPYWAGTFSANYSDFKSTGNYSFQSNNHQIKFGVKRYLASNTIAGTYNLNLQLFYDKNFNGILDKDELPLINQVISLDKYIALTDKNGRVNFRNIPEGNYRLRINESNGLRIMSDPNIIINKNKKLQLGLVKNNKVTGKLKEIKQVYDILASDIRGIIIYAEDEFGHKSSTLIDQNGEFEFFLNNGIFTIYIENTRYTFTNPSQNVILENADYSEPLIFEYKKKGTEIKVKKF